MRPAIASIISGVKEDSVSGCSEMTSKLLQNLRSLLNTNRSMTRVEWQEFANELRAARPGMAPFHNIANRIEVTAVDTTHSNWNDAMAEMIDKTLQEELNAASEIAEKFLGLVQGGKILTMSYSGTVMSTILRQLVENDITVYVTESMPLGEGRTTVKRLASHKIHVRMIPDSMVGSVVDEIDYCLVGADAITKKGLINKVGTRAMAATCMTAGKTFYVLSSELKIADLTEMDLMRTSKVHDGFTELSQNFELTPYELIDTIVTNKKVISPNSLAWK
jgi:translation initiation factor 2B subunit (eIF-2B alpha/beta/delta family)